MTITAQNHSVEKELQQLSRGFEVHFCIFNECFSFTMDGTNEPHNRIN